jgi:hypothetical protein
MVEKAKNLSLKNSQFWSVTYVTKRFSLNRLDKPMEITILRTTKQTKGKK